MTNGRVREYIGARYVPVFADPVIWDDERAYDPLTMVQYSGETYMSKQYVPIGAQLPTVSQGEESNEYWVHMSNWNAQVEAYREEVMRYAAEVLEFDGRIDTLEADLPISEFDSTNTVKAYIDNSIDGVSGILPASDFDTTNTVKEYIDNSIDSLGDLLPASDFNTTDTVKAHIDSLDRRTFALENKKRKFILIGDSFAGGYSPNTSTYKGWLQWCEEYLQDVATCYHLQHSLPGLFGFAASRPFIDVIEAMEGEVGNPKEITDIVVLAGTNDLPYMSLVPARIAEFCQYCHETYPYAKVKIGMIGTDIAGFRRNELYYREPTQQNGAEYIADTMGLMALSKYISTDGTHLTQDGYRFYAPYVLQAVISGHVEYGFVEACEFDATGGTDNYTFAHMRCLAFIDQNETRISFGPNSGNYSAKMISSTDVGNAEHTGVLGTFANLPKLPAYGEMQNVLGFVQKFTNDGVLHTNGQVWVTNDNKINYHRGEYYFATSGGGAGTIAFFTGEEYKILLHASAGHI